MKNLLFIAVFFFFGCTCDNSGKKDKVSRNFDYDQKGDTTKLKSEIIYTVLPTNSETVLKENNKSESQNLNKGKETKKKSKYQIANKYTARKTNDEKQIKDNDQQTKNALSIVIQTFKTGKGWGYDIIVDGNKYIHQEIIPAVPGIKGFDKEENSRKVADFVAYKIRNNIIPPSVTPKELDSLGIDY